MNTTLKATGRALRAAAPLALATALVILTQIPIGSATAAIPAPNWPLMLVFYFSIHRPRLVPPAGVALVGLFQDLLWGGPPGLNMLLLLLAQMVLSNQQAHFVRLPFLFGWAAFLLVAGIAMVLSWIVASLYYGQVMSGAPLLLQTLLTVGAYPVAGWVFGRLDAVLER